MDIKEVTVLGGVSKDGEKEPVEEVTFRMGSILARLRKEEA